MRNRRKRTYKPQKIYRIRKVLRQLTRVLISYRTGLAIVVIGAFLLFFPLVYKKTVQTQVDPQTSASKATNSLVPSGWESEPIKINKNLLKNYSTSESPLRIVIPSLGIDLAVVQARIIDGYWELSEVAASYGLGSSYPGRAGNTVIFAHARNGLFLPLRQITKGAVIYVLTTSRWHRYKVEATKLILPSDLQEVRDTENETLTLFTCSGFLDSKRLIVTALPDR